MRKFIRKNPADEHTCEHCRAQIGSEIKSVEEVGKDFFGHFCKNPNGCRCYVEEDKGDK